MWCNKRLFTIGIVIMISLVLLSHESDAKKPLIEADTVVTNTITGKVSAINDTFISVVYQEDPVKFEKWEMDIPIVKDELDISGAGNFNSIKVGDTIRIDFNDYQEDQEMTDEQGQKVTRKDDKITRGREKHVQPHLIVTLISSIRFTCALLHFPPLSAPTKTIILYVHIAIYISIKFREIH